MSAITGGRRLLRRSTRSSRLTARRRAGTATAPHDGTAFRPSTPHTGGAEPSARPADARPQRAPTWAPTDVPSATAGPPRLESGPASLQVNAVQAMCRQVFGFRLAMIALAAPAALLNASPGLGVRLVGAAVVVTFMGSYVLYRDWERFGPLLLRHPALLVADTLLGSLPLISAGPQSSLAYVSVCTPLLAGIVYGWRGAACFASLQALILLVVQAALHEGPAARPAERLLLPGFCVITGAVGSTLRTLLLRYGTATQALTSVRTRLAVTEAIAAERARLAREMHDSVAKTLHGLALTADSLAHSAASPSADPVRLRQQADLVARAARRAAAESRAVLTDLRAESPAPPGVDVLGELEADAAAFAIRTGRRVTYRPRGGHPAPLVPPAVARHLLTITSEALDNAHRHADPTRVDVEAAVRDGVLRVSVRDDGRGLPPGTTLDRLRQDGHFGLVGMVERAAAIGARIRIGPRPQTARRTDSDADAMDDVDDVDVDAGSVGTEVTLELPLPRTDVPPPPDVPPPTDVPPPATAGAAP